MSLTGHNLRRKITESKLAAVNKKEEVKVVEEAKVVEVETVVSVETQPEAEKPKGGRKKQSEE